MTSHRELVARVAPTIRVAAAELLAARRTLAAARPTEDGGGASAAGWVSEPEMSDASVTAATGRGWDEWRRLIDASHVADAGHTAVAAWLVDDHGVDAWWAQSVTVGWERITGRRFRHQRADGTFSGAATRTLDVDASALRAALLDDATRREVLGGITATLRSGPAAKTMRLGVGDELVLISLDAAPDGRTKVSVAHEQLATPGAVGPVRAYWSAWLDALEG